jgi:crotonobetainyl-CoA:carnitine CoA-transferase CaiB-like acyl-CoA transferase
MLVDDTAALYIGQNRNKKCVALNIKKDEGRDIFYRLVEKADVMIESTEWYGRK